ncbi:MAG: hypothetical protein IMF00_01945 [Proteobacteria bacterium]|nr:hypothetical protein [Pseudomonadota bacterium]
MARIFRWHISRLYEEEDRPKKKPRILTVTVTPQNMEKDILEEAQGLEGLARVPSDNLDWWDLDAEIEIEGIISEDVLIRALAEDNIRPVSECVGIAMEKTEGILEERQLKEDMVCLQIVEDTNAISKKLLDEFQKVDSLKQDTIKLLWSGSRWLDFTPQARRMSADLYKKVFGEEEKS